MEFPPDNQVRSSRRLVQMSIQLQQRIDQYNQNVAQLEAQLAAASDNILAVSAPAVGMEGPNMQALGTHALNQAQANANLLRLQNDNSIFQRTRSDVMVALQASRFVTVGSVAEAAVVVALWSNNGWRGTALICSNAVTEDVIEEINNAGIRHWVLPANHEANAG